MAAPNFGVIPALMLLLLLLGCSAGLVNAQEESACYSGGSIAAAVVITAIVVLLIAGVAYYGWKRYGKYRKGKHLILETDPEKGRDEYAFDNPGFKEPGLTPLGKPLEKNSKLESGKPKWTQWSPLGALTNKNEKRKTVDDFAIDEETAKVVALRSHDFTGLGFNICGNMRDGIFIKDVLHRGPASESGKLNPGDRISSITISFEHIVYEDALTILSYASPYEVIIQARNGKLTPAHTSPSGQPGHPLYKSSSSTDLLQIGKSAKKRLFQAEEMNDSMSSNYSSLHKTRSTATTLERNQQDSPKQKQTTTKKLAPGKTQLNTEQLKSQLEQKILEDHNENLKQKQNYDNSLKLEVAEPPKTENKFQKFGIKVLPLEQKEQKSPKSAELSQNDNNINIERHTTDYKTAEPAVGIILNGTDEVDKTTAPPVKKREKKPSEEENLSPEPFIRKDSTGITRDQNGIPQEIPNHMLNAATAARKNRKTSDDHSLEKESAEKTPKKLKGKAPAPPEGLRSSTENIPDAPGNLDEISKASDDKPVKPLDENLEPPVPAEIRTEFKEYNSDSDVETDNQSSVNTIELNASDITIHQTEDNEDKQSSRKTASTGDLTKIQKTRKISTGTLERAQSLDITDTGMPVLSKKRKGAKLEDNFDSKTSSDESLYGKALINKEPRLSLILDGLNTFQRSRLKKSTEWGNLEDAILRNDSNENLQSYKDNRRNSDENFGAKSPEFDALVNKINEIKQETSHEVQQSKDDFDKIEVEEEALKLQEQFRKKVKNEIWPSSLNQEETSTSSATLELSSHVKEAKEEVAEAKRDVAEAVTRSWQDIRKPVKNEIWPAEISPKSEDGRSSPEKTSSFTKFTVNAEDSSPKRQLFKPLILSKPELSKPDDEIITIMSTTSTKDNLNTSYEPDILNVRSSYDSTDGYLKKYSEPKPSETPKVVEPTKIQEANLDIDLLEASKNLLSAEREASAKHFYNFTSKLDDTNVSDDIKVSRHSLGSLERPKFNESSLKTMNDKHNVSNITVSDKFVDSGTRASAPTTIFEAWNRNVGVPRDPNLSELYTTALDETLTDVNTSETSFVVSTPDLIKNVSIAEAIHDLNNEVTVEGPTSLTFEIPGNTIKNIPVNLNLSNGSVRNVDSSEPNKSVTYVTEIQVITPNTSGHKNISEIEILPSHTIKNLDSEFENYVRNFESSLKTDQDYAKGDQKNSKSIVITEKIDPEKELHKIKEIAEEQLKKLPEMRFTTSSYEQPKTPEKRQSQIELLRSNFEKSPPKPAAKPELPSIKSRIPIATTAKTPPTSPERRDSRNLDFEMDKEIIEIMSSGIHSTPNLKYQPKTTMANRNVTVTSIRNSKIPSGLPTYGSRPPVPPRKSESSEGASVIQLSPANGASESSSFKQWVFNPSENSVTNITVTENKTDK